MPDKDTIKELNDKIQKMNSNPDALDIANEKIKEYTKEIISKNKIIKDLKTEKSKLDNEIVDLKGKNESLNKTMVTLKSLNNNLRNDVKKLNLQILALQKEHHKHLQKVIQHAEIMGKQNFKDIKF